VVLHTMFRWVSVPASAASTSQAAMGRQDRERSGMFRIHRFREDVRSFLNRLGARIHEETVLPHSWTIVKHPRPIRTDARSYSLMPTSSVDSVRTLASTDQTIGIIFPILGDHVQRFFRDHKTVFVKYLNEKLPLKLRTGSRLFFYQSGSNKLITGDAKIVGVESATYDDVLTRFLADLFLTRDELERYAQDRKDKRMLVLVLADIREYSVPLRLKSGLTMAGRYMTKNMLDELRENS